MTQNPIQEKFLDMAERLKVQWFPQEDDIPWKQWVDFERRGFSDLLELLKEDVRDTLKARVLFLLLIPGPSCSPFYFREYGEINLIPSNPDFLRDLSIDLLKFAFQLMIQIRKILAENAELIVRKSSSGSDYDTFYYHCHNAIYKYGEYLLELLALLSDKDDKNLVFEHYWLLEPIPYNTEDDASCGPERSRYQPFERLLERADIGKEWKYRADEKMRQIILDEISGKTKPRQKWEDALDCYRVTLNYQPLKHYSKRLFAKQAEFLVSQATAADRNELIGSYDLGKFFKILAGPRYKGIRYQFARYFIKTNLDLYCDAIAFNLANMILVEFGQHEEIKNVLEDALAKRRETVDRIAKRDQGRQKDENSILDEMR